MDLSHDKLFICLEGIVGAGKTTQINRIHSHLSPDCYLIPELNYIPPMKELREELRRTGRIANLSRADILKLARARGEIYQRLLSETDKPVVLMDRGIYTAMVFESEPLSMWEVEEINKKAGVIVPDLCFVLYCSANEALQRIDERRIREGKYLHRAIHENEDFIKKTKRKYFEIAKKRHLRLIPTSESADQVENILMNEIRNMRQSKKLSDR
jgi:dTMP kinase